MPSAQNTSKSGIGGPASDAISNTLKAVKDFIGAIFGAVAIVLFGGILAIHAAIVTIATASLVATLYFLGNGLKITWAKNRLKDYGY